MHKRAVDYASSVAILVVCVISFSGCGGASKSDSRSEPGGTSAALSVPEPQRRLNCMGHWEREDLRETFVREIASDFAFRNPDIDLNLKFCREIMGEKDHCTTARLIAQMIREDRIEWDVIWLDDGIYFHVAKELGDTHWGQKHLVDFEAIPEYVTEHKDFILTDPKFREKTGGVLVSPYLEGYVFALWYNLDIAEMLGLNIKQRDMTMDDLLGYARRLREYNQAHGTQIDAFSVTAGVEETYLASNLVCSLN